jgi:hypothetical protein
VVRYPRKIAWNRHSFTVSSVVLLDEVATRNILALGIGYYPVEQSALMIK